MDALSALTSKTHVSRPTFAEAEAAQPQGDSFAVVAGAQAQSAAQEAAAESGASGLGVAAATGARMRGAAADAGAGVTVLEAGLGAGPDGAFTASPATSAAAQTVAQADQSAGAALSALLPGAPGAAVQGREASPPDPAPQADAAPIVAAGGAPVKAVDVAERGAQAVGPGGAGRPAHPAQDMPTDAPSRGAAHEAAQRDVADPEDDEPDGGADGRLNPAASAPDAAPAAAALSGAGAVSQSPDPASPLAPSAQAAGGDLKAAPEFGAALPTGPVLTEPVLAGPVSTAPDPVAPNPTATDPAAPDGTAPDLDASDATGPRLADPPMADAGAAKPLVDPATALAALADAPRPAASANSASSSLVSPDAALRDPGSAAAAQTALVAARDVAFAVAQAGDANRVEVRLDPPELGRVQIDIRFDDGAAAASVSADRPETLELLRRHADTLQRELTSAGFTGANVAFSDRRPGQQPQIAQAQPVALELSAPAAPVAHGYARPRPGSLDRLDIRL